MKSLDAHQLNQLEAEIYMENQIREFEHKITDNPNQNDDKNKLRSFIKEYINSESKSLNFV